MDIQIVHNGVQMGPFTEEVVHAMLKSGSVLVNDLAWRPGLATWVPLMNVLYPAATEPVRAATPAPAPPAREPATAKQKAFLSFVAIPFAPDIAREDASDLVNDAMENPRDPARLARWNEDRLRLHPELFVAEIQARKENRPQHFLEISHAEGAPYFAKVTKAHCQVLVSHLDVRAPRWDAREPDATWKHFFPALAEKFPQLLTPGGSEKFKPTQSAATAQKPGKSAPVAVRPRPVQKPGAGVGGVVYALGRGVFIGLIILGLLWVGRGFFVKKPTRAKKAVAVLDAEPAAETEPAAAPAEPPPKDIAPVVAAATEPAPLPAAAPEPMPAAAPMPDTAPLPAAAPAEPAMAAADMKEPPAAPEPPAKPEMAGLFSPPEPAAAAAAPRTSVVLTKPVAITLPFGKISVPAGTTVKIVSHSGAMLTVKYLDHVVTVPVSSTDLDREPAPAQ